MDDITSRRLRIVGGAIASVTAVGAIGAVAWRNRALIGELMSDGEGTSKDEVGIVAEAARPDADRAGDASPATTRTGSAARSTGSTRSPDVGSLRPRPRRPFATKVSEEATVPVSTDPEGDLRRTCEEILAMAPRLSSGEITAPEMVALVQRAVTHGYGLVKESPFTGGGRRWRHVARNKTYGEIGRATLHVADVVPVESDVLVLHRDGMGLTARLPADARGLPIAGYVGQASLQVSARSLVHGDVLVLYGDDDQWWARERGEFLDGRFEPAIEDAAHD